MSGTETDSTERPAADGKAELAKRLDVAGWGVFLIWVAVAIVANLGWGIGLIGVGVITLAGQVARRFVGRRPEWFWVVAGCLFVAGGISALAKVELPLVPVLLAIAGVAMLASAICGRHHKAK